MTPEQKQACNKLFELVEYLLNNPVGEESYSTADIENALTKAKHLVNAKIWTVTAESESGDDYGVIGTFDHEPTEDELNEITCYDVIGCDGWDISDKSGPGWNGSYLHIEVWG